MGLRYKPMAFMKHGVFIAERGLPSATSPARSSPACWFCVALARNAVVMWHGLSKTNEMNGQGIKST